MTETLPLQNKQDSAKFTVTQDDPTITLATDGGYEYTRPRYTSVPKKSWTIGFTNMLQEEHETLMEFWNKVRGCSDAFYWTEPTTGKEYLVRFKSAFRWQYKGAGPTIRWDCDSVTIKEV